MEDNEVLDTQDEVIEQPAAVEQEPKSMDDTIRETLDKINARGEETEEQASDRARDDKGRFAKQERERHEDVPPSAQGNPEEPAPIVEDAPVTVPPELQRLGLRKEEAEAFAKADPMLRDAFLRRSEEMHRGLEGYRQKAQYGHEFEQALQPYMQTIQQFGVHPAVAAKQLFAADHALRYGSMQEKQQMMMKIAQDYRVDLNFDPSQLPQVDPNVSRLEQQVQQLQSWIQQQNQAVEEREAQTLNSEISRFASDPANTYFEQVRGEMAGLLQAGIASDLKDAYEKAIYANPTIRAQVLAKQQAESEAKRKVEAAQKAQEAKRAAAVNVSKRGNLPAAKPIGSMEDTIRAKAQELGLI